MEVTVKTSVDSYTRSVTCWGDIVALFKEMTMFAYEDKDFKIMLEERRFCGKCREAY